MKIQNCCISICCKKFSQYYFASTYVCIIFGRFLINQDWRLGEHIAEKLDTSVTRHDELPEMFTGSTGSSVKLVDILDISTKYNRTRPVSRKRTFRGISVYHDLRSATFQGANV